MGESKRRVLEEEREARAWADGILSDVVALESAARRYVALGEPVGKPFSEEAENRVAYLTALAVQRSVGADIAGNIVDAADAISRDPADDWKGHRGDPDEDDGDEDEADGDEGDPPDELVPSRA